MLDQATALAMTDERLPALERRFLEPPGFRWGSFAAADGTPLRCGHLAAAEPIANCVLVGGFTEFIEKYFETIATLASRGLSVWTFDWRGQGGSARPAREPARPRRRNFDRDAADLVAFAEAMLPGGAPRVVIAHSMGGAIALLALAGSPGFADGAVLSAPMLGLATGVTPAPVARLAAATATWWGLGRFAVPPVKAWGPDPLLSPATSRTSHDEARCRVQQEWVLARPELGLAGPTYAWVNAAFALTDRLRDPAMLRGIATPILLGSPGQDRFVDPAAHRRAAALLPDCALLELPDARHEPFHELEGIREPWLATIGRFVEERLAAAPGVRRRQVSGVARG